jgi:hypothetical protein
MAAGARTAAVLLQQWQLAQLLLQLWPSLALPAAGCLRLPCTRCCGYVAAAAALLLL